MHVNKREHNMFRSLYAAIYMRWQSTESIMAAFDMLSRTDPVKSGVDIRKFERAKRLIAKELLRRPDVDFDFYFK